MKILVDSSVFIEKLYHISDIHIRLYARLEEYEEVFQSLYSFLEEEKKKHAGMIVITGDILHNKNELSPECILCARRFLQRLAAIFPTVFIAGNHDALLNNNNRMDSLTAVMDHSIPDLYYLRDTGHYRFSNIIFGVSSLLDNQFSSIIPRPDDCTMVALYHGGVGRFRTNKDYVMEGVPLSTFDGYDMVLLGDIHLFQYLDKDKRIAYAGSLISQNYTETDTNHGVLVWDVRTHRSVLIPIENPYAHREGILETPYVLVEGRRHRLEELDFLPRHCRLNLILSRKKTADDICFMRNLNDRFPSVQIKEKSVIQPGAMSPAATNNDDDWEQILFDYFATLPDHWDKERLMPIFSDLIYSNEKNTDRPAWDILCIEFDNMFGYGPNNIIDFEKFPSYETIGIFGPNSAGKSTIIEIVLFLLFGQISRYAHGVSVPREVIRFGQTKSRGLIRFRVDGVVYEIEKHMTLKANKIRVDEKMWRIVDDRRQEDCSEEHRKKTDKRVVQLIGSYQQFLFTTIFLQQNEESFRSMAPSKRKEFLSQLLNLDRFEEIYKEKNDEFRSLKKDIEREESALRSCDKPDDLKTRILDVRGRLQENIRQNKENQRALSELRIELSDILNKKRPCPENVREDWNKNEKILNEYQNLCKKLNEQIDLQARSVEKWKQEWRAHPMHNDPDMDKTWKSVWNELDRLYKQQIALPDDPSLSALFNGIDDSHPYRLKRLNDFTIAMHDRVMALEMEEEHLNDLLAEKEDLLRRFDAALAADKTSIVEEEEETAENMEELRQEAAELVQKYQNGWNYLDEWEEWSFNEECASCQKNRMRFVRTGDIDELMYSRERWEWIQEQIRRSEKREYNRRILQNRRIEKELSVLEKKIRREREKISKNRTLERLKTAWRRIHEWDQKKNNILFMNQHITKQVMEKKEILAQLEDGRRVRDQFHKAEGRHCEIQQELDRLLLSIDDARTHRDRLKEWMANEENNRQYDGIYQKKMQELATSEEESRSLMLSENKLSQELEAMEQKLCTIEEKMKHYNHLVSDRSFLQSLLAIIGKDGFPMYMMEHYLPVIETQLNEITGPFIRNKQIRLQIEKKKENTNIQLYLATASTESIYVGGMEAFIIDAALKIVFARISRQSRCNMFIIDEGISALDKKNMENIDQFFQFLEAHFPKIFIISHLREVREFVRHALYISKEDDGNSRIIQ